MKIDQNNTQQPQLNVQRGLFSLPRDIYGTVVVCVDTKKSKSVKIRNKISNKMLSQFPLRERKYVNIFEDRFNWMTEHLTFWRPYKITTYTLGNMQDCECNYNNSRQFNCKTTQRTLQLSRIKNRQANKNSRFTCWVNIRRVSCAIIKREH